MATKKAPCTKEEFQVESSLCLCFPLVNPTSLWRFWQVVSLPMHAQVLLFAQPFGLALYDWQLICQVFLPLQAVGSFMWFLFFFDQA